MTLRSGTYVALIREQHGYLSLGTDAILAERVSAEAAEPLGVPVSVEPIGTTTRSSCFRYSSIIIQLQS